MSSLASIIAARGPIRSGDLDGDDVKMLQLALSQAGYRVGVDGQFGPRTLMVVRQFQQQHGLHIDGVVGAVTAAMLDAPHDVLVKTAQGITSAAPSLTARTPEPWLPHDDTASLLKFYGRPWEDPNLLVHVTVPFRMTYQDEHNNVDIHSIQFNRRAAQQLSNALNKIWDAAGHNDDSGLLTHVRRFSGSYNYRPIRGSSRLSCHAFGAAVDFDAERLPLGHVEPVAEMPEEIVAIFKSEGFFWGGDYTGRKDPMHFQLAHE